jgi:hypothetical protein
MTIRKSFASLACALMVLAVSVPGFSQGSRGKAEMKAGGGAITIDYGRPSMKGRDMLGQLKIGDSWRMGSNQATKLSTPVELAFGTTKVAKGDYSLFLKRTAEEKFELVFNTQTGQWGTQHDAAKDTASVPLKKEALTSAVEALTIELKEAAKGGTFSLSWGTVKLSADFEVGK